jgi:hypothetical protein
MYSRNVQFDEGTFPVVKAQSKSLSVSPAPNTDVPSFDFEAILPYADLANVNPDAPAETDHQDTSAPVDDYPVSPETGRHWIYVPNGPPAKSISSTISSDNIVTGRRQRPQVCYVATSINPKSHGMAMKSVDADN